jgi:hypothetical protein
LPSTDISSPANRYDQGLPVLVSAPAYFKQNAYHSPSTSKTGPLQFAHNTPLDTYSYWQTLPGVAENFNTFMNGHFAGKRLSWLEWFPAEQEIISGFDSAKSPYLFIDVGGGRGHEANLLKLKFPSAKGKIVVEDLPDVIDDVRHIDSSIELQKYNFFEPQPLKGTSLLLRYSPCLNRVPFSIQSPFRLYSLLFLLGSPPNAVIYSNASPNSLLCSHPPCPNPTSAFPLEHNTQFPRQCSLPLPLPLHQLTPLPTRIPRLLPLQHPPQLARRGGPHNPPQPPHRNDPTLLAPPNRGPHPPQHQLPRASTKPRHRNAVPALGHAAQREAVAGADGHSGVEDRAIPQAAWGRGWSCCGCKGRLRQLGDIDTTTDETWKGFRLPRHRQQHV